MMVVLDQGGDPISLGGPYGGPASQALLAMLWSVPGLNTLCLEETGLIWLIETDHRAVMLSISGSSSGNMALVLSTMGSNAIGCDYVDLIQAMRVLMLTTFVLLSGAVLDSTNMGSVLLVLVATWPIGSPWFFLGNSLFALNFDSLSSTMITSAGTVAPYGLCDKCWPMGAWMGMLPANGLDCMHTTHLLNWGWWITSSYMGLAQSTMATMASNAQATLVVLSQINSICCNGARAFSLSNCVSTMLLPLNITHPNGTVFTTIANQTVLCLDHRTCFAGMCFCNSAWTGRVCQNQQQSGSLGTSSSAMAAISAGTAMGILALVVLGLIVAACVAMAAMWHYNTKHHEHNGQSWFINHDKLKYNRQLGNGAHATVYQGMWRSTVVAIKMIWPNIMVSRATKKAFYEEIKTCIALRCPNMVLFMGATTKPPAIIMEYMPLGSVYNLIGNKLVTTITFEFCVCVACQAAKVMAFLHNARMIHRDLKSPNVLLDAKWNAKIANFGMACILD